MSTSPGRSGGSGPFISVVVPNFNGAGTLGKCLESLFRSRYRRFEVIVVDDCSEDGSEEIARGFPCRFIRLPEHSGASKARNTGAAQGRGEALFFTDSDCVLREDTLEEAAAAFARHPEAVTGGTYTPVSHDRKFFSTFQSVFVNYSESKNVSPDYVATHAMVISRKLFAESGGFAEEFLPILEDVEFSHRLKRKGVRLRMEPALMVEHIFGYSLVKSMVNAFRKSMYWTIYSLWNKDLLRDSGTASIELKANTLSWSLCALMLVLRASTGWTWPLLAALVACLANLAINRHFLTALFRAGGPAFAAGAALYYTTLYPVAVGAGGIAGTLRTMRR
jgi:GT2 family glycosyltransferase